MSFTFFLWKRRLFVLFWCLKSLFKFSSEDWDWVFVLVIFRCLMISDPILWEFIFASKTLPRNSHLGDMFRKWMFPKIVVPPNHPLIGVSIINHPFWGTPIFGNTQIGPKTPSWQIWHRKTSCVCIPRWWHRGSPALKSFWWKVAVPYQLPIEAPTRTQWPQGELLEVVVAQKINRTFRLVDLQRQDFTRFCLEKL